MPPHPALSPESWGEGKGEGEIPIGSLNSPRVHFGLNREKYLSKTQDCGKNHFCLNVSATIGWTRRCNDSELYRSPKAQRETRTKL